MAEAKKYRNRETGCFVEAHPVTLFKEPRMVVRQNPDEAMSFPTVARFNEVYEEVGITPQEAIDGSEEEWEYLAMDKDGIWCFHGLKPELDEHGGEWMPPINDTSMHFDCYQGPPIRYDGDWRDSLHKRGGGK